MNEKPKKCDLLEIWLRRSEYVNQEVLNEFARLKRGIEGEKFVLDYIKKYGRKHWKVMQNLWLDYYGTFESDLLLLTRSGIYPIEIKNYNGFFQYNHGISKLNNREISGNAIYQTRRATKKLRELIGSKFYKPHVQGVLVFVGEDNPIEVSPPINDIDILQRNQLKGYIQKICEVEDHGRYQQQLNIDKVAAHLKNYEVENPYQANPISTEEMAQLKKGILCAKCDQATIKISRKFVHCACGHVELRDKAMIRTICEYGVLNFEKKLTRKDLFLFLNGQSSMRYLNRILNNYFEMVRKGKYTYYVNLKLPFYKVKYLFNEFTI